MIAVLSCMSLGSTIPLSATLPGSLHGYLFASGCKIANKRGSCPLEQAFDVVGVVVVTPKDDRLYEHTAFGPYPCFYQLTLEYQIVPELASATLENDLAPGVVCFRRGWQGPCCCCGKTRKVDRDVIVRALTANEPPSWPKLVEI